STEEKRARWQRTAAPTKGSADVSSASSGSRPRGSGLAQADQSRRPSARAASETCARRGTSSGRRTGSSVPSPRKSPTPGTSSGKTSERGGAAPPRDAAQARLDQQGTAQT